MWPKLGYDDRFASKKTKRKFAPSLEFDWGEAVRTRGKSLKHRLPQREAEICLRLAEARKWLEIDQAAAARKIGIPKSTLSNYELCVVPLKADLALRICRKFIISEEWLATGRLTLIEKAGKLHGVEPHPSLRRIYVRMCMDLASAPEASRKISGTTIHSISHGPFERSCSDTIASSSAATCCRTTAVQLRM